ncbi:hypothetical protein fh0823_15490 [Francisella halioticida]|nr:NAD-dependent epimerase/dehydratase family protein [Francisella halioticida]BCD91410.1 hypothetical protein fh0823_15490 [Francisella halioticida]
MNKVLVTGASGFIGRNLTSYLKNRNVDVIEHNRIHSLTSLKKKLKSCDFIFHLAGEVRPRSTEESFVLSNVTLTEYILDNLVNYGKKPILLSSTIHAERSSGGQYGISKKAAEELVKKYSIENGISSYIYRLPHVFGEGCKPNYNSAISTWIYNIINGIPINIYDRSIKITYVYVQDIVCDFYECISIQNDKLNYMEAGKSFEVTLGEVEDYLLEFRENTLCNKTIFFENEFKNKLFKVFKYYYEK